ncbi:hypothetical protein HZC34_04800 [Candidatus Saganbacteria bacterium]|nr:hypothetical protein [Candidatus Saganbacteria bacterium]
MKKNIRSNTKNIIYTLLVIGIWSLVICAPAAAVPQYINYQGVLKDAAGNLQTGTYSMAFKIYGAAAIGTGTVLNSDSAARSVSVSSGIYNVSIEATNSVFNGTDRWLEVTVGSEVLSPRLKVQSSAYAITSGNAVTAETISNYRVGVSGAGIVPTTDATGLLSSSVIPVTGSVTLSANSLKLGGYLPGVSGVGIVPTTDATTGKLATSVIPTTITVSTADSISGNISTTGTITASATANTSAIVTGLNAGAGTGVYGKSNTGTGVSAESTSGVALDIVGKIRARTGTGFCAGTGTIALGDATSGSIANTAITTSSVILLTVGHGATTAALNTNGGIRVSTITNGTSFVVATMDGNGASAAIPFSYLIIN